MFFIYRQLTKIFFPFFIIVIYFRKFLGKEDKKRYQEKFNVSLPTNFEGDKKKLIWFHGASIGEILSIIPLINYLVQRNNKTKILITSVTLSSSKIIKKEFGNNENIYHHFFPADVPHIIEKFLDTWNPKFIGFVDSEVWPNFLSEIKKRKIPLALINGRITKKTFNRWKLLKKFSKKVFSSFDICLASSEESLENLKKLGANNCKYYGNLKYSVNIKKNLENLNSNILNYFKEHKVWCAASTHDGEEIFCINVHKKIKEKENKILTVIVPRHITRIKDIYSECIKMNLNAQILNNDDKIKEGVEIILVNSFGNLEKYYSYCKCIFMGKSLIKKLSLVGGQNPIEAAKRGCKIYHGPYVYNFFEVYKYLNENKIAEQINDFEELSKKILIDLKIPKQENTEKVEKLNVFGNNIFKNTINELKNLTF